MKGKYTFRAYEDVEEPEDIRLTVVMDDDDDWEAHALHLARKLLNYGTGRVVVEKPDGTIWEYKEEF